MNLLNLFRGACCGVVAVLTVDDWRVPVVVVALVSALVLTDVIQETTREGR